LQQWTRNNVHTEGGNDDENQTEAVSLCENGSCSFGSSGLSLIQKMAGIKYRGIDEEDNSLTANSITN
jgi:hypothetical protein